MMHFFSWIEPVQSLAVALRTNLPWVFLLGGAGLQLIGAVAVLHHRGTQNATLSHSMTGTDAVAFEPSFGLPSWLPPMLLPLEDTEVPTDPSRLPGAQRPYRGGTHEGVDFRCARGTPVRAVLDGVVLAVRDAEDLPSTMRTMLLAHCRSLQRTPSDVLDVLHGQRILVSHGLVDGRFLVTAYSHLGVIRDDLRPGTPVQVGEVIAWTGASGTSHAYTNDGWSELHFEIHIDGVALGTGLGPREAGALYRAVLREEL